MYAISKRGFVLCAALLVVAVHAPLSAQAPAPAASSAVARDVAERMLVRAKARAAARVLPVRKAEARSGAGSALSGSVSLLAEPLKSARVPIPGLRPTPDAGFLSRQLQFPRVRRAYDTRAKRVAELFARLDVVAPEVFFRVFKREQVLEVWVRDRGEARFELLSSYPVCKLSGRLGPKRRQGDRQIPEGFYEIDLLNPQSNYHLSMRVDYPNAVDRARGGQAGGPLGGDIFIHGGCATIGCVPVTDRWIEELYLIAIAARQTGQAAIPVHIFPTRLDDAGMRWLARTFGTGFVDYAFWRNLREGYTLFEDTRAIPAIGNDGLRYTFQPAPAPPEPAIAGMGGRTAGR